MSVSEPHGSVSPADVPTVQGDPDRPAASVSLVGEICFLFAHNPPFASLPFGALRNLILPPIAAQQVAVARARRPATGEMMPVACVLWADASDDVDARLRADGGEPSQLQPDDWTSGSNLWLIAGIGDDKLVSQVIEKLRQERLAGREVHYGTRGHDGARVVKTLPALALQSPVSAADMPIAD